MDWETAKTRVLSVLKQRAEAGEPGLSSEKLASEIRAVCMLPGFGIGFVFALKLPEGNDEGSRKQDRR